MFLRFFFFFFLYFYLDWKEIGRILKLGMILVYWFLKLNLLNKYMEEERLYLQLINYRSQQFFNYNNNVFR